MPKEAWSFLVMLKGFSRCRLCLLDADKQEYLWQRLQEGATYRALADEFGFSPSAISNHKQHLLKAYQRYLQIRLEQSDELKKLDLQLQYEREKRKQLELAREREERARIALETLRDFVSPEKWRRIEKILLEGSTKIEKVSST